MQRDHFRKESIVDTRSISWMSEGRQNNSRQNNTWVIPPVENNSINNVAQNIISAGINLCGIESITLSSDITPSVLATGDEFN